MEKIGQQIRQMEKKTIIIGLIIIVSVVSLLATPAIANAYAATIQELAYSEGYESVELGTAALNEKKHTEIELKEGYLIEFDGYITEEDEYALNRYEKGIAAAKSFAELNGVLAERENGLTEKRLTIESSEKLAEALSKGADLSVVDWSVGKTAFIEEWTARINTYLEGSKLEGYGYNFAVAAGTYCVDPRWSPAISFIESGKGKVCIRPHNAGGGGHITWPSWEKAIDRHVYYLSVKYGYTITEKLAKRYCPPTGRNWYYCVNQEMLII